MVLKPHSVKQFSVALGSQTARFTKATVPAETKNVTTFNDGGTGVMRKHTDFSEMGQVELSKPFDASDDAALYAYLKGIYDTSEAVTVTVQPVKSDYQGAPIEGAKTITLAGCVISSLKLPDADREGTGLAMLEITLEPGAISYQ